MTYGLTDNLPNIGISGELGVTVCTSTGAEARKKLIELIWEHWHMGVPDTMPMPNKPGLGVAFDKKAGKYVANYARNGVRKRLGSFDTWDEANAVSQEYHAANPTVRRRKLASCKNLYAKILNEDSGLIEVGRMQAVERMEGAQLVRVTTKSSKSLVCAAGQKVHTNYGWVSASDLVPDKHSVTRVGKRAARMEPPIPPRLREGIGLWTSRQRKLLIDKIDRCWVCGTLEDFDDLELDHRVPVVENIELALVRSNLSPICRPCHKAKSAIESNYNERLGSVMAGLPDEVVSVSAAGVGVTYAITMQGEWQNFFSGDLTVAAGFSV